MEGKQDEPFFLVEKIWFDCYFSLAKMINSVSNFIYNDNVNYH